LGLALRSRKYLLETKQLPVSGKLLVGPAVPKQIQWIELLGIPGRWGRADAFARGLIESAGKSVAPHETSRCELL
jgi:hypothetical protein